MPDPYVHVVERGHHISWIAEQYNVSEVNTIWDANPELKAVRQNANLLVPGDRVLVPLAEPGSEGGATERHHPFDSAHPELFLRMRILKEDRTPLAQAPFRLLVSGAAEPFDGTTNDSGQIEVPIPRAARQATLTVRVPPPPREPGGPVAGETPMIFDLDIGALSPILEPAPDGTCVTGVQQRLANLGFYGGPITGELNEATRAAIRAFRRTYGLSDGDASEGELQRKLAEVHDRIDSVVPPAREEA